MLVLVPGNSRFPISREFPGKTISRFPGKSFQISREIGKNSFLSEIFSYSYNNISLRYWHHDTFPKNKNSSQNDPLFAKESRIDIKLCSAYWGQTNSHILGTAKMFGVIK